jgi:DNA (cytosine-5)-methyltransferase 1
LVENVIDFMKWNLYPSWCDAMYRLGYCVAPHVVDAADFGVPQNRERLFLVCTRSKHPLHLEFERKEHVPAESFIQWSAGRWSDIHKPGRSKKTLQRIENGRQRFGERFIAPYYSSGSGTTGRDINRPIGTITTNDRWAIINEGKMRMLSAQEAKHAMSFEDDYILPDNHKQTMHMLGNAVPPLVARDFITAIMEAA